MCATDIKDLRSYPYYAPYDVPSRTAMSRVENEKKGLCIVFVVLLVAELFWNGEGNIIFHENEPFVVGKRLKKCSFTLERKFALDLCCQQVVVSRFARLGVEIADVNRFTA